jgi:glutamate racemase
MKYNLLLVCLLFLSVTNCKKEIKKNPTTRDNSGNKDIIEAIIKDTSSFYFINFKNYPINDKSLPIGVFDSGTGGLTVLKAIVNFDENENITHNSGSDGVFDFEKESFIYLGDQANMPYGNYYAVNKVDLLKEHIIKDTQFLLGNKYYSDADDSTPNLDKQPVKVIVVACNTATAYGKEHIEDFIKKSNLNIKVIGVIDAGVRGTLETLKKDENTIIGVLATEGTVSSKGYENTLLRYKQELGYKGKIEVFSQGGIGIAEAVDEDPNYYNKNLKTPRENYKGPGLDGDVKIDKTLFDIYNFNFDNGKMLCDSKNVDDCSMIQINDAENYVRYHLVSLIEKIRLSKSPNKLKSIILGCTHYPYLTNEIHKVLKELYNYKTKDGAFLYQSFMEKNIQLIDPAIKTAKELHDYLKAESLFNNEGNINESEFYISVANKANKNNVIDSLGRFTYDYKYGRKANEIQEYVKVVPFSRTNISNDILTRFQTQIPHVYRLMQEFSQNNEKTKTLSENDKI